MQEFFSSGRIADVILAVMAAEWIALVIVGRLDARRSVALLIALLPGAFVVLAMRSALTGEPWPWMAMWLSVSLVAHVLDLGQRWRGKAA